MISYNQYSSAVNRAFSRHDKKPPISPLARRAVILSLLLSLVLVGGAFAAFIFQATATISLNAGMGTTGSFEQVLCYVSEGPGTMDSCIAEYETYTATISASGLENSSQIEIRAKYNPADYDQIFTLIVPGTLPAGVSAIYSPSDGTIQSPGTLDQYEIFIELADMTAGQTVDPFQIGWQWTPAP